MPELGNKVDPDVFLCLLQQKMSQHIFGVVVCCPDAGRNFVSDALFSVQLLAKIYCSDNRNDFAH